MKPLLYVDGYNVIGAWPQAQRENWPLDVCRDRLIHLLEDYAGYSGQEVWLVFDGYRTDRTLRTVDERDGLTVVYTRHGETADHYIERQCQEMPKYREARVATSDNVEQTVILVDWTNNKTIQLPGAMVGAEPDPQPGSGSAPPRSGQRRVHHCRCHAPGAIRASGRDPQAKRLILFSAFMWKTGTGGELP